MRVTRIYHQGDLNPGQLITLSGPASHHLRTVLRQTVGASIVLFNDNDCEYQGSIHSINKQTVTVNIEQCIDVARESPLAITLIQGISRGERMDWVIQKAVELGIRQIQPVITERCVLKLNPQRWQKKWQHWQQIAIHACEQSGRTRLPSLQQPETLAAYLNHHSLQDPSSMAQPLRFVLSHRSKQSLPQQVSDLGPSTPTIVQLLVGPEGGLAGSELDLAEQHGFQPICLGPRVMRTETAAITTVGLVQYLWGDLHSA